MRTRHKLEELLAERISAGLKRKAITTCSKWAEEYRVMGQPFPGPWSFKRHPWSREMHNATEELIVGQKGAQLCYTETALNKAFYAIDVLGVNVMYILPASTPDASDFSTSRFDPALELSSHLAKVFSDVKNVGHKRAGNANLFIRGSRSRSQLKSVPASMLIFDEVDEMVQDNIPLAFERTSGQLYKQVFMLSTPTIDNYGINGYFNDSSQDHFFFPCPSCSKSIELVFPNSIVITGEHWNDPSLEGSHLICSECKAVLPHDGKTDFLAKGKWVATYEGRSSRGFHINQLYSPTIRPAVLARAYLKSTLNPADEQEFYNSKLGLTHVVEGARVTDSNIEECMASHKKTESPPTGALVTMGIDVGKWLHYEISQWYFDKKETVDNDINLKATCRLLQEGKVLDFESLDTLMKQYRVIFCVIDANPERRKALEFAQRFWGHVRLCFYATGITSKQIHLHDEDLHTMSVDRTSWLDLSLGRFRAGGIRLPVDVSYEYKSHIKALVRVYDKDANDNPIGRYVKGNEEDHFAHARNYCEMALPLALGLGAHTNISKVL